HVAAEEQQAADTRLAHELVQRRILGAFGAIEADEEELTELPLESSERACVEGRKRRAAGEQQREPESAEHARRIVRRSSRRGGRASELGREGDALRRRRGRRRSWGEA